MESFNDFIKNKFNADIPEAPKNLQWDAMQSGILSKLDEETPAPTNTKIFVKGGIIVAVLLCVGLVICNYVSSDKEQNSEVAIANNQTLSLKSMQDHAPKENASSEKTGLQKEENPIDLTPLNRNEADIQEEPITFSETANAINGVDHAISASVMASKKYNSNNNIVSNPSHSNSLSANTAVLPKVALKDDIGSHNIIESKMKRYGPLKSAGQLEINRISALEMEEVELNVPIMESLEENNAASSSSVTFGTSLVLWKQNHGKSQIDQLRNEMETTLPSFQSNFTYQYAISKNWSVSAGLEYQSLESRFNYENVVDFKKLQEGVVKKIEINYVTKDSNYIYGDTLVNARSTRKVVHFNSSRLINIPIYVYKSWNTDKWSYELSAGTVINIFSSSKGRTLSKNEEVQDYSNTGTTLYKSWKGLAVSTGLSSVYHVNPALSIGARMEGRAYVSNWNVEAGNSTKPYMLNAGIFGRFNF